MREDYGLSARTFYHKQKLVFIYSAMRHFAAQFSGVTYQRIDPQDNRSYLSALIDHVEASKIEEVLVYEPANAFIDDLILDQIPCRVTSIQNPMFLSSREDWQGYRNRHKRLLMHDFYVEQRKRLGILMDNQGQPLGGQWSFDQDNRKKLPSGVKPPPLLGFAPDSITQEVIDEVERLFPSHPGHTDSFAYPVSRDQALSALGEFFEERFANFGDYEDAISQGERTIFHSVLSPCLNVGLLNPDEVIWAAAGARAPLNSKEGFIRQIVGWREFVYHLSREYSPFQLPNFLNHHRRLANCWYEGTTGLPPLDHVIRRVGEYAWCHHIERLMILGSVMLMCETNPNNAYRWFMEMFIDSADWVMLANVVGMSQFADGGSFATKPYVSGSNYILKMSDYRKGDWCEVWDGLYWNFLIRNHLRFASNHRMTPMLRLLDRMDGKTKEKHQSQARKFIERVTLPPEK